MPSLALAQEAFPANNRYDANVWAAQIRADVRSRAHFDHFVPPTSNRSQTAGVAGYYSASGTNVYVGIRFFKVESVAPAEGQMRLKVWVRMQWVDERLAWSPASYGGVSSVFYQADSSVGSEAREIWVPDIQPYNVLTGLAATLDPSMATVSSDGTVFWSRPGSLDIMCKFSGLAAFPFDKLKCPMDVGGWSLSGGNQGIELLDGGFDLSIQEASSGSSYQQHTISSVSAELRTNTYPCCPSEPWPAIVYTITMDRAQSYFVFLLFVPGVAITLLSFAVFFTDTASADALGYGIGVIVVNLLLTNILVGVLPACGEVIWVDIFALVNTGFCCLALFQSSFNIMLENLDSDHLMPTWVVLFAAMAWAWLQRILGVCFHFRTRAAQVAATGQALPKSTNVVESVAGVLYRQQNQDIARGSSHADSLSPASGEARCIDPKLTHLDGESAVSFDTVEHLPSPHPLGDAMRPSLPAPPVNSKRRGSMKEVLAEPDEMRKQKLLFFEALFYSLDEDCSLFISGEECELLLSYTALDLDPAARADIFRNADGGSDGKLNRVEFVNLCIRELWFLPKEQLTTAVENCKYARNSRARRNRTYWTQWAAVFDIWSRALIPSLYGLALILVFNLELSDDYDVDDSQMFDGIGPARIHPHGIVLSVVYSLICMAVGLGYLWVSQVANRRDKKKQEVMKRASTQNLATYVSNNSVSRNSIDDRNSIKD